MSNKTLNNPAEIPAELDRWNWGAFLLNWIWGIGNSTFIALLTLIPGLNIIMMIVLGLRGSRWAWRNRYWKDADHFRKTQHKWAIYGIIIWVVVIVGSVGTFASVPYLLKRSEAYQISLQMIRADDRVRAALGDPIETGFWTFGKVNIEAGGTGSANLVIPVTGSKESGSVTSYAIRSGGQWDLRLLLVKVHGSESQIVLVNKDNLLIPNKSLDI